MSQATGGAFCPPRPWESFDHAPFRRLPPETWSATLYLANELSEAWVDARCLDVLTALGLPPGPLAGDAEALAEAASVHPDRRGAFAWLLRRLRATGLLRDAPTGLALAPSPWSAAALQAARDALGAGTRPAFDLVDHVAAAWPAWLRGEMHGARVLFSREALALWGGYFHNANRIYGAVNALAAAGAAEALAERRALRVLEVGGGLGSGAEALLGRLGARVASYRFSEVSPVFLKDGEARLRAACPQAPLEVLRLDLNDPLPAQGVAPGSADLVFGVNTLHAARDLEATLGRLREALAPGGLLVVGETLRDAPGVPQAAEFVFQLTREFGQFVPVPGLREEGGFLTGAAWAALLARAGFASVRLLPDPAAARASYPGFQMAAILAEAP